MPSIKIHCSVLGIQALKKAIDDYEGKMKIENKTKIIHVSDYYHDKTGHALNNVVERLAKKQKINVYTSKNNIFGMPYDDSQSLAEIKRFRGVKIGTKTIFLGLIPRFKCNSTPASNFTFEVSLIRFRASSIS